MDNVKAMIMWKGIRVWVEMLLNYGIAVCVIVLLVQAKLAVLAVILGILAVAMMVIPQEKSEIGFL